MDQLDDGRPPAEAPRLHLTFDDGPDPIWTPRVLDHLATAGATATFFLLGAQVRRSPGLVDAIREGGHAVGLHGDAHLDHARTPVAAVIDDTRRALGTLEQAGVRPSLWRLPWGRSGPATAQLAGHHGLDLVGWDHDTHDWRGDGWDDQPASVRAAGRTGGIVLLHDGFGPGQARSDLLNTLEVLAGLVHEAALAGTRARALGTEVPA